MVALRLAERRKPQESCKQIKLSPIQKGAIVDMFAKLDESKMWRLSTGTVVEQQMQMFALECNYEH